MAKDTGGQPGATGLYTAWQRRTRLWALVFAALTLVVSALLALMVIQYGTAGRVHGGAGAGPGVRGVRLANGEDSPPARDPARSVPTGVGSGAAAGRRLLPGPRPGGAAAVPSSAPGVPGREADYRHQGARLDTTTRVLAAASAIIPIFGFPDWEWDQINEVLIYPTRFDGEFEFGDKQGHNILGMVGTGSLNRLMILSKPDLINGFRNATDKRNVGVHEFAHLVDKTDGVIDGVPRVGLDRQAIGPWIDLVRRKMAEIEAGKSDINRYAPDQ